MKVVCKWMQIPVQDNQTSSASKIRIYDAGDYIGFLFSSSWKCYKVLKRTRVTSGIEEELEEMPEDWVPYSIYSEEEYPLFNEVYHSGILELQIPGWSLQFVPQEQQERQGRQGQEKEQVRQEQGQEKEQVRQEQGQEQVRQSLPSEPLRHQQSTLHPSGRGPRRPQPPQNIRGDILIGSVLYKKESLSPEQKPGGKYPLGQTQQSRRYAVSVSRPPLQERDPRG